MPGFLPYKHALYSDRRLYRNTIRPLYGDREPPKVGKALKNPLTTAWWMIEGLNFDGWCLISDDNPYGIDATHIREWFVLPGSRGHQVTTRLWHLRRQMSKKPFTAAIPTRDYNGRTLAVVCGFEALFERDGKILYRHENSW